MPIDKSPVSLKAARDAMRRLGAMTCDEAEDRLIRAREAANSHDHKGPTGDIPQLDGNSHRPGLDACKTSKRKA